jgi:hypothetical protein
MPGHPPGVGPGGNRRLKGEAAACCAGQSFCAKPGPLAQQCTFHHTLADATSAGPRQLPPRLHPAHIRRDRKRPRVIPIGLGALGRQRQDERNHPRRREANDFAVIEQLLPVPTCSEHGKCRSIAEFHFRLHPRGKSRVRPPSAKPAWHPVPHAPREPQWNSSSRLHRIFTQRARPVGRWEPSIQVILGNCAPPPLPAPGSLPESWVAGASPQSFICPEEHHLSLAAPPCYIGRFAAFGEKNTGA